MTTKQTYILAGAIILLVLAIIGHAYIASGKDVASAEAIKQLVAEQAKELRAERDAALAVIERDKRETVTPQQIVVKIPEYVPGLPEAPQLRTVEPSNVRSSSGTENKEDSKPFEATSNNISKLPNAPSSYGLYFPPADVKPLFDRLADCKGCEVKLDTAMKENKLLLARAESAEKAMRGGGFWSRLKSNAKWLGIGLATGAAAGYVASK
jgi:hypothetical protein